MHQASNPAIPSANSHRIRRANIGWWVMATLNALSGLAWLLLTRLINPAPLAIQPTTVERLQSGAIATLNSPVFVYSSGWHVNHTGADPHEPADPWHEPSGVLTFA